MKTWGYSRQREQSVQILWGRTCSESSEFWIFPFHFSPPPPRSVSLCSSGESPPALRAWTLHGFFRLSSPDIAGGSPFSQAEEESLASWEREEPKGRALARIPTGEAGKRNYLSQGFESRERGGEMRRPHTLPPQAPELRGGGISSTFNKACHLLFSPT